MTRRGDIWLVEFGSPVGREQAGIHPAVVVSTERHSEGWSGVLMVVPLTTSQRGPSCHIKIEPGASDLESVSYAKCEDLKSVLVEPLVHREGAIEPRSLAEIGRSRCSCLSCRRLS
jgi:mRNA interferase MazF